MAIQGIQLQSAEYGLGMVDSSIQHSQTTKTADISYKELFQSLQQPTQSLKDMWKSSFEKWFSQSGQFFYHVSDATQISDSAWQHNDFPFDKLTRENIDSSVFSWQPSRSNPSQLDSKVQAKTQATLGKHSIIVPPELEEKMSQDPELARKVAANIDKVYEFHRPMPHLALPGTKFYGNKAYGSVIVLNKDGEVEHSCVTSGGGIIGPDEHTLRQIEREQERKQKRKDENRRIAEEGELKYINNRIETMQMLQSQDEPYSISAQNIGSISASPMIGLLAQNIF